MLFRKQNTPRWIIFTIDILIVASSVVFAYLLRFNFDIPDNELKMLPTILLYMLVIRTITFVIARTYAGLIRYTSTYDAVRIFVVITSGSIFFALTNVARYYLVDEKYLIPFSIIIIEYFIVIFAMTTFRLLVKIAYLELINPRREKASVIIFGAGEAGIITKRTLDRDAATKFRVVAFLDDDAGKAGKKLENIAIYHSSKLVELLESHEVESVIIAIQQLHPDRKQYIIETCLSHDTRVQIIPPVARWINGELSIRQIKKINIEDLLEREIIQIDRRKISSEIAGKNVLVTGASGSIGSELVRQLAAFAPSRIILVDQAESPLFEVELECTENFHDSEFEIIIGDICNMDRMKEIFSRHRPAVIFHSAAYKHVPMMEKNAIEAVHTNVMGTRILADLAVEFEAEKFIMISTDKAVNPTNVMGASKRIAEIYSQSLNSTSSTRFITTRFGNVLGSNGSVIPLFRRQIEKGGPVSITHPDVTRYFMTIPEACQLVIEAGHMGEGGEIFIFDMGESVKIVDLAKKMIKLSGLELGKDIQIRYSGLRPGEKLYEELLNDKENTLPTYHPQIMIAKVREYDPAKVKNDIEELNSICQKGDETEIVRKMKALVPEFKSRNSLFQSLDEE